MDTPSGDAGHHRPHSRTTTGMAAEGAFHPAGRIAVGITEVSKFKWTPDDLKEIPNRMLYAELQRRKQDFRNANAIHIGAMESLMAGIVSGGVTRTVTSPLDVVKILLQLQRTAIRKGTTSGYSGTVDALRKIYNEEGLRGLWKGNFIGCLRLAPYAGVKFMMYDSAKAHFGEDGNFGNFQRILWGGIAGIGATLVTYPLEVVRTRMILQKESPNAKRPYRGAWDALLKIYQTEGMRGWFKGGLTGCIGVVPFEGVQFACYESMKEYAIEHRWPAWRWSEGKRSLSSADYLVIGSMAGAIAQTVSYPFDVVKRRLQAQSNSEGMMQQRYSGMVDCFRMIVKEEGFGGLMKGTVPNLAKVMPYAAVMFYSYEMFIDYFKIYNSSNVDQRWEEYLSETGGDSHYPVVILRHEDSNVASGPISGILPSDELNH